jgi:hypothetical protein
MKLRRWAVAAVAIAAVAAAMPAPAQKLYAASVRTLAEGGSEAIGGSLYAVALATGSATLVAPIKLNGESSLGVTGLAVHPTSGVMYGITSPLSRTNPTSLVTIDPETGNARMVGSLRLSGSDIAFNRMGILFTWLPETHQLGVVNLDTGNVTPIGNAGPAGPPAGLAIDATGTAYITAKGATGTVDTVDIATGAITVGPQIKGSPFDSTINSMTFTPSGLLLAVNSNQGSPAATRLITINTATGVVNTIGHLPDDTDALAFATDLTKGAQQSVDWRTIALITLGIIALIIAIVGFVSGRRD